MTHLSLVMVTVTGLMLIKTSVGQVGQSREVEVMGMTWSTNFHFLGDLQQEGAAYHHCQQNNHCCVLHLPSLWFLKQHVASNTAMQCSTQ